MEERLKFVATWLEGGWSMTELCAAFGVSRKTGYKFVERYTLEDIEGLRDRSRAAHRHPNATVPALEAEVIRLRRRYGWGGRKIVDSMARKRDRKELPARSTVDAILKRRGLVKPRRRRQARSDIPIVGRVENPNDEWCADFKGWFRTRDGTRCDPLTVTDSKSRFLLRCAVTDGTSFDAVKPHFVRAFHEYGLPQSIRTDNGPPFASQGIGGLCRLSVWLIRLGIRPHLIDPGKPQQNGKHERMHRTLKAETARPPRASLRAQQHAFNEFREMYNHERPHEGIAGAVPADIYECSTRSYPSHLPELAYPDEFWTRRVSVHGAIKLAGDVVFLGRTLRGQLVGLQPGPRNVLTVHFGPYEIAAIDQAQNKVLGYRKPRPVQL